MKLRFNYRQQYDLESEQIAGEATKTVNDEPSLTQQQFREQVDLNHMVELFGIRDVPVVPINEAAEPIDFTGTVDLRTVLDRAREAQEQFNRLPAKLRDRFANDPVRLHHFITDPSNIDEAVRLGILHKDTPAPAPEPMAVRIVNPEGADAPPVPPQTP